MGKTKKDGKGASAKKSHGSSEKAVKRKGDTTGKQRAILVEVEARDEEVQRSGSGGRKNTVSVSKRLGAIKRKYRLDARGSLLNGDRIICRMGGGRKKDKPDTEVNAAAISWMDEALSKQQQQQQQQGTDSAEQTDAEEGGTVRRFVHSAMAAKTKTGSKLPYTATYRVVQDVLGSIYGSELRAGPKTINLITDSVIEVCNEVTKRAMVSSSAVHMAKINPDTLKAAYLTLVMDPLRKSRSFLPSVDRLPAIARKARAPTTDSSSSVAVVAE